MTDGKFSEKLYTVVTSGRVLAKEPMSRHTTFRVGGPADYFVEPGSIEEIKGILALAKECNVPLFVVGNGSNLLVRDGGIRGIVMHLGETFREISVDGCEMTAQAGAQLGKAAAVACSMGLTGMEFAAGIPGSIGGALRMNAGAYGGEMKQIVTSATCLTEKGELVTLAVEDLKLGYRRSILMERDYIVLSVTMHLAPGQIEEIKDRMADLAARRLEKQPLEFPSAGSTFKRPEGYFAGKLIMDAGLAGMQVGGAKVSEKHCGFVINAGNAAAEDVEALIRKVQEKVWQQFGVQLEPEIIMVGEEA